MSASPPPPPPPALEPDPMDLIRSQNKIIAQQGERIEMLEDMVDSLIGVCRELEATIKGNHHEAVSLIRERTGSLDSNKYLGDRKASSGARSLESSSRPPPQAGDRPVSPRSVRRRRLSTLAPSSTGNGDGQNGQGPEVPIYGTCFGNLYKLSTGGGLAPKSWNRRWFVIKDDGALHYYKTAKASTDASATTEFGLIDLNGYIIQKALDVNKPFAFKAIHPSSRNYYFCSESEEERTRWMAAMTEAADLRTSLAEDELARLETMGKSRSQILDDIGSTSLDMDFADFVKDARHFGWMTKLNTGTQPQKSFYILKTTVLHYYASPQAKTCLGSVQLPGFSVVVMNERQRIFKLMPPVGPREIVLSVDTDNEYFKWVSALTEACRLPLTGTTDSNSKC
eukprot:m.82840 g.82840  ORF g.82840 m.82840 type:complete len:396 (+) comp14939_c0_seq2:95-1282(+)